ncbi:MAG: helix-hairpin-helix domain-containing protein [Ruminococcus sp.]|nr:helix-hairpin-helix domain-containing protein [Ruminococcus sp.]
MPNKRNKEAILIISAGIMLAGSAVWRFSDGYRRDDREIIITTAKDIATAAETSAFTSKAADSPTTVSVQTTTAFLLLDINSATAEELTQLSGIGDHLAAEIVAYREQHGGFLNIEELMEVSGIGKATFADIREHVFVVNPVYTTKVTTEKPTELRTEPAAEEETEPTLTLEDVAPIDLNTADIGTLVLLPHVDEETAEEMIDLRERLGRYSNAYELLYVDSLTQAEVADILEYVTVDD